MAAELYSPVLSDALVILGAAGIVIPLFARFRITTMRDRLHAFPRRRLDLWMVWYTYQLGFPVAEYIALCDVITTTGRSG